MTEDYRVQEYTLDQGVFWKSSIYYISRTWYRNCNNDSLCRRLVILPADDAYGKNLPDVVRSWDEMRELVYKLETAAMEGNGNEK